MCSAGAYLRDAWCRLDGLVVTLAWLPILFPAMGNYSVLRAFRALRPLRALHGLTQCPHSPLHACTLLTDGFANGVCTVGDAGALKRLPGMPVLVQWILSVVPKMATVRPPRSHQPSAALSGTTRSAARVR
jgi:hypothetical protein